MNSKDISTAGSSFSAMPLVTRQDFNQMTGHSGGDCWNRYHVLSEAFKNPDVRWVCKVDVGTGLWAYLKTNLGEMRVH